MFPQAIGVASTWDPALNQRLAAEVGAQMRATGAHQGLSPVLDVCRDPRWGRTEETYGEDPHLVASMGIAFVRGLQGPDLGQGAVATAKHFAGHGASEGGLNWAPPHISPRELREVHLHPFEAVVRVAGLKSIMSAYHELDGIPCAANAALLTDVLRRQWGFTGAVVSDYFSIRHLAEHHHVAAGKEEAAAGALGAGLDVELPATDCYGEPLRDAVSSGLARLDDVERAAAAVLRTKLELGLFERPLVDVAGVGPVTRSRTQLELARDVAVKSLVLLKNDGVLPLAPSAGSIAVIGPNADEGRHLLGDYSYAAHVEARLDLLASQSSGRDPGADQRPASPAAEVVAGIETVYGALNQRLAGRRVAYARGCAVNSDDRSGFEAACELAAGSDVAIMVMGDRSGLSGDCTSGESRDVSSLRLRGVQEELVAAVAATGTPVVLILVSGRPSGSEDIHALAGAVLMAWLPGEQGGEAIADVVSGAACPSGKLPITFPRHAGQIPIYHGHKATGGRSHWKGDYVDSPVSPLYPFGFGLSYTTFELEPRPLATTSVGAGDEIVAEVEVRNTGDRAGDEVVQLYVRDPVASVTRPVLELKSFARVPLEPSEARIVRFSVPVAQLGFYGAALTYVVEPGELELLVGTSADALQPVGTVRVAIDGAAEVPKAFGGTVQILQP
jgi:beta-glucosidase